MMRSWLRDALYAGADFISVVVHPLSKVLARNRVRILCYHRVCDLPDTDDIASRLSISPREFAQQMEFLHDNSFNVISLDEFVERRRSNRKPPPKTVIITFDDGYRDNYIHAFPILKRFEIKATIFVVTNYIDSNRIFDSLAPEDESDARSREVLVPLASTEMASMMPLTSFGSHSMSHCRMSKVDQVRVKEELRGSKESLERITSKPATTFSYPFGDVSESVKSLVKAAGYAAAVCVKPGTNTLTTDVYALRRTAIISRDSPARFKRKVEGAYDWFLYLVAAGKAAKRTISRRTNDSNGR